MIPPFAPLLPRSRTFLKDLRMPSPILKPKQSGGEGSKSVTSTPKPILSIKRHHHPKGREEETEDLSLDIQNFFVKRGAVLMPEEGTITDDDDDTETPNLSLSGEEDLDDLSNPITCWEKISQLQGGART